MHQSAKKTRHSCRCGLDTSVAALWSTMYLLEKKEWVEFGTATIPFTDNCDAGGGKNSSVWTELRRIMVVHLPAPHHPSSTGARSSDTNKHSDVWNELEY